MPENINFISIWKGASVEIKALKIDNQCPALIFLDELTKLEIKKRDNLFHLFDLRNGKIINNQKIRKLHFTCDHCFEFKPTGQIRISFIYLKQVYNHICLLDGFKKKQNKWPRNKIKKTERLCRTVRMYEKTIKEKSNA